MFKDNSGVVGYKQNDKVIIKPRFEEGNNFHFEYTSAKFDGKWGIINMK